MVKSIKELSTELHVHLLSDWYILEQTEVEVEQSRISECVSPETAEMARVRLERASVDVFGDLFGSRTPTTKGRITN